MFFKEYPVFQTIEEAKSFCSQGSRMENRKLLCEYIRQQEPLFTKYQMWAAPSIYFLQYLLNELYDLNEAFLKYNELSLLEKHGIAHLIISLSAPYWEGTPLILLAESKAVPPKYIVYISVEECGKKKDDRYCRIWKFNPLTCERKVILNKIKMTIGVDQLKSKIQDKIGCGEDIYLYETVYSKFDSDDISYFGNYIHKKVKEKMAHEKEWMEIKTLRNRLAHPHEGISESNLKNACDILCAKEFIKDIEALVFLLSPLLPEEQQMFCQHGYHNNYK